MAPWKAAGTEDDIPAGLLITCGVPAYRAIAALASANLELEYFPRRFKLSGKVVLPRPGKTTQERGYAGGWRPIALLSVVGKVVETVVAQRVAAATDTKRHTTSYQASKWATGQNDQPS